MTCRPEIKWIPTTNNDMITNLKNRNFLKLLDFTPEEIKSLLDLSFELKKVDFDILWDDKNKNDIREPGENIYEIYCVV